MQTILDGYLSVEPAVPCAFGAYLAVYQPAGATTRFILSVVAVAIALSGLVCASASYRGTAGSVRNTGAGSAGSAGSARGAGGPGAARSAEGDGAGGTGCAGCADADGGNIRSPGGGRQPGPGRQPVAGRQPGPLWRLRRMATILVALASGIMLGSIAHARVEARAGGFSSGFVLPVSAVHADGRSDDRADRNPGAAGQTATVTVLSAPAGGKAAAWVGHSPSILEARIETDPAADRSGGTVFRASLLAAETGSGARAGAAGPVTLVVRNIRGPAPVRGSMVRVCLDRGASARFSGHGMAGKADGGYNARLFVDAADVSAGQPPPAEAVRSTVRKAMLDALSRAGGDAGPMLQALIVGVRGSLDDDISDGFIAAGCAHILSLSGQHISILATLVAVLLGTFIGAGRARVSAAILAGLYLYLVGASPPVSRAVTMFWLATAARVVDRPQRTIAVLSLTALGVLLTDPDSVHTLSFKLTYLAMIGLVQVAPVYDLTLRRWVPPVVSGALAAGLGALATTAPLSIITFGYINPFSPLTSALAGPVVALLMYAGIAGAVLVSVVPLATPVASFVIGLPYRALVAITSAGASVPALAFEDGQPRVLAAAVVAALALLVYAWPHVARCTVTSRTFPRQLRRPIGPDGVARAPGAGHAQEIRSELPDQRQRPQTCGRSVRRAPRRPRLGDWSRNRCHDQGSAAGGTSGVDVRD